MAKQNGLGDLLFLDGYDLSGDVGAVDRIGFASGVLDVTAISSSGMERIHSHVDGEISFKQFFNDAAAAEHEVLKAKGSGANRIAAYFHGSTLGNVAAGLVAKQINYDWERPADGGLAGTTQLLGNAYGLEYCEQLTAGKRTDGSATNGTGVDGTAATAFGLAAYLQVFAFTGTSVTVTIQESSDNGGGDPYAAVTGGAFAAATAIGAQRIVTALTLTVERYLRVVTTGTFSNAVFAVCATRYPYAA